MMIYIHNGNLYKYQLRWNYAVYYNMDETGGSEIKALN